MENQTTLTGKTQGQKILSGQQDDVEFAKLYPAELLAKQVEGTDKTYGEIFALAKANPEFEKAGEPFGIGPKFLRQIFAAATTAHFTLNREKSYGNVGNQYAKPGLTHSQVLDIYRENDFSLHETYLATNIALPALRRSIKLGAIEQQKPLIKGQDWGVGKKKKRREKFRLFPWIAKVHNHFSLKVFCESEQWHPKFVLDMCHKLNEAGYPVTAPKIVGSDLQWLKLYDPSLGTEDREQSYDDAINDKAPKKRGGKEIFKRLLHQENPGRRQVNLPSKGKKFRNRSWNKRGYNSKAGGKCQTYDNPFRDLMPKTAAKIQNFLNRHK